MISVIVAFICYFSASLLHIILYRIMEKNRRNLIIVNFSYVLFLMVLVMTVYMLQFWGEQGRTVSFSHLPLTSILLYLSMCIIHLIYFLSPLLGDEGPSMKILFILRKLGKVTKNDLLKFFSDSQLIEKRLSEMEKINWITYGKGIYRLSDKGKNIAGIILFYKKIMNWPVGG